MRTIVVALAVALVTAGSATAAFVVTSKNIKNGTIQLVDMSAAAKTNLRGPPRSPAGFTTVTQVLAGAQVNGSGSVTAQCPAGTKVTGGGFDVGSNGTATSSLPNVASGTWQVYARTTGPGFVRAFALCAGT